MRIPIPTNLKTRTGVPDKDPRMTNCYVEVKGNDSVLRKRAGINSVTTTIAGDAQGGIEIPGGAVVITGDTPTVVVDLTTDANVVVDIAVASDLAGGSLEDNTRAVAESVGFPNSALQYWILLFRVCENITIPPANDRGVSVDAGPSEVPYGGFTPIETTTTILRTNCWTLHKRSTKTYSQRVVPNQQKAKWAASGDSAFTTDYAARNIFGYGSSVALAKADCWSRRVSETGVHSAAFYPPTCIVDSLVENPDPAYYTIQMYGRYPFGPAPRQTYLIATGVAQNLAVTVTIYYLDVHEVWTYYII